MSEKKRLTTQRKRKACGELRCLAAELGVELPSKGADLNIQEFSELRSEVKQACQTPDHHERVEKAQKLYDGDLPEVPQLPALAGSSAAAPGSEAERPVDQHAEAAGQEESQQQGFRLRSQSCLSTYNSETFTEQVITELWLMFLHFLRGLHFLRRWTATLERSLNSEDAGRLHLHAFLEN